MKSRMFAAVATITVCCLMVCMTGCASTHLTQNFQDRGYELASIDQGQLQPQIDNAVHLPSARVIEAVYDSTEREEVSPRYASMTKLTAYTYQPAAPTVIQEQSAFTPQPQAVSTPQTVLASCSRTVTRQRGCTQRTRTVTRCTQPVQVQAYEVHRVRVRTRCSCCNR